jgi:hypothetical protein
MRRDDDDDDNERNIMDIPIRRCTAVKLQSPQSGPEPSSLFMQGDGGGGQWQTYMTGQHSSLFPGGGLTELTDVT